MRSWARLSPKPGPGFDLDVKASEIAELREQVAAPDLWNDQDRARKLTQRLASLEGDEEHHAALVRTHEDLEALLELGTEVDDVASLREVEVGVVALRKEIQDLEVRTLLGDLHAEADAIVTIQAGAGGTESNDWAFMLFRMYTRWCERRGFGVEIIEYQEGDEAGLSRAAFIVKGRFAFGQLSCEHGVHRLVRISPFDAQKRRHTSFAGLDVIPALPEEDLKIEIPDDDLRIDVYRSSGAGGQHVNTTDSAVRITHLPTGLVVTSQNQRSQLQNRATALVVLKGRLVDIMLRERKERIDDLRGEQRSINFGSQIRNYVMAPYQLVKDVRTGHETSGVDSVLDGDIDSFIRAELERRRNG